MQESADISSSSRRSWELARESLALYIEIYARVLIALLDSGASNAMAKVARLSTQMRRHVRLSLRLQGKFFARMLAEDLQTNPAKRAQVRRDLGGTIAIVKWERRRREAKLSRAHHTARAKMGLGMLERTEPAKPRPDTSFQTSEPQPRLKSWKPRTDRNGHYRWASITTGQRRVKITRRTVKTTRQDARFFFPVEVTSDDLKLPSFLDSGHHPPPKLLNGSSGYSPPIDRPPVH